MHQTGIWRDLLFQIFGSQVFAINFEFHGVHGQQTRWSRVVPRSFPVRTHISN
jgi:hypothetical protein